MDRTVLIYENTFRDPAAYENIDRPASASLWPTTTRPPSIASGSAGARALRHPERRRRSRRSRRIPRGPAVALSAVAAWDPSTPRLAALRSG
ncbi:MAG: hypothetical protein ACLSVD_06255 [Eggerthellaceae bacterium]